MHNFTPIDTTIVSTRDYFHCLQDKLQSAEYVARFVAAGYTDLSFETYLLADTSQGTELFLRLTRSFMADCLFEGQKELRAALIDEIMGYPGALNFTDSDEFSLTARYDMFTFTTRADGPR